MIARCPVVFQLGASRCLCLLLFLLNWTSSPSPSYEALELWCLRSKALPVRLITAERGEGDKGTDLGQLQTMGSHRAYGWHCTRLERHLQLQLQLQQLQQYSFVFPPPPPSPSLCLEGTAHFNWFCHSKLIKSEHSEWKSQRRRLHDAVHSLDTNNSHSVASVAKSKTEADRKEEGRAGIGEAKGTVAPTKQRNNNEWAIMK